MQISNAQSRAIAHGTGPAMVLAGPGSGKTLVITQRTKYLIEHLHVEPREILVITFTKAAAQEMRLRFDTICTARGVTFGTFHAVFFNILKYAYHYTSSNILTEDKKYQILQRLVHGLRVPTEDEKELIGEIASEISLVKNEQIDLGNYYSKSCSIEVFCRIYENYEKTHREMGFLDFDDMLVYTWELLRARADILESWQRRFKYILVDEFQDINLLQYRILQMLAAPENNLFIVGDDDQSIYRFRGAKPEIMLHFPEDYPETDIILLNQNFRSLPEIMRCSKWVIEENKNRFKKDILPVRESDEKVDLQQFENQEHESLFIVRRIRELADNGVPLQSIAVLFRTNQGAGPFARRLMEFNIPFEMRDTLPNIYEHWIARDILAYIHLAFHGLDRTEFLQVMNRPKRYISRDSIDTKTVSFETLRMYNEEKAWMLDRINQFEFDLKLMQKMTPFAAVNFIRNGIRYEEYLSEYAREHRINMEELTELLDEIQLSARPFRTMEEWLEHINTYKEHLRENQKKNNRREDAVIFATLHSAKGLEFTEVFLTDVNENNIPHRKANTESDLEEERRLLYVGMTRARDVLHICYIREKYGKIQEPSRFLDVLID